MEESKWLHPYAPNPDYPMGMANEMLRLESPEMAAIIDLHFNEPGHWAMMCRQFLRLYTVSLGFEMEALVEKSQEKLRGS